MSGSEVLYDSSLSPFWAFLRQRGALPPHGWMDSSQLDAPDLMNALWQTCQLQRLWMKHPFLRFLT